MADDSYTEPQHIADVWRPLRTDEEVRARGLIAQVERLLVDRWPEIPNWIASDRLDDRTFADVVAWLVLPQLGTGTDIPVNARSWQDTGGTESRQVTLADTAVGSFFTLEPWMVGIFDRLDRDDRKDEAPSDSASASFGGGRPLRAGYQFPTWPWG